MSDADKKEASEKISVILTEIAALYDKAETIAEEADVYFNYSGPSGYGDSGSFYPKAASLKEAKDDDRELSEDDYGWSPSSNSC